jgi:hypothetical protein
MTKRFTSDVDIDFADRTAALSHLSHVSASILRDGELTKHASGVYFTQIPHDPVTGMSTIPYDQAEQRGYVKVDFLNMSVYQMVRDEQHLNQLLEQEPDWRRLRDAAFFQQLVHIGSHYETQLKFSEPINSVTRMAMFLAVIRPAKRHLIGKPWNEVAKTIWDRPTDGNYYFKKSHGISYAHLVKVHMNLLSGGSS